MVRYPHVLQGAAGTVAVQDENGYYPAEETLQWQTLSLCRSEVNGSGNKVSGVDGSDTVYSSMVFLPLSAPNVAAGTVVRIMQDGAERIKGQVLRHERLQMHSRIWL